MDNGLIFPYPPALKVTENKRYCVLTEMYVEATVEVAIVPVSYTHLTLPTIYSV